MSRNSYDKKNRALPFILIIMVIAIAAVLAFMLPTDMLEKVLPKEVVNGISEAKDFLSGKIEEVSGVKIDQDDETAVTKHYSSQEDSSDADAESEEAAEENVGDTDETVSSGDSDAVESVVRVIRESLDAQETTISLGNVDSATLKKAINRVYRMPYYFWLDREYKTSTLGTDVTLVMASDFEDIDGAQAQIDEAAAQILSEISSDESDYRKARAVYEGMVNWISYNNGETKDSDGTIYGALVNRSCVCEGYAKAFVYLMEKAGLEADIYTGTAVTTDGTQESHAWNSAVLYGQLYYFDVTWGDQDDGQIYYDWFALTSEQMGRSHFPDEDSEMPYSDAVDCNYYYLNDLILYTGDEAEVSAMIAQQGYEVDIMCSDANVFGQAGSIIEDSSVLGRICSELGMNVSGYTYSKNNTVYTYKISFY